jgi:membrane protease YdiL (CAAX protease family)
MTDLVLTERATNARTTRARVVVFFLAAYAFTWFGNVGNWIHASDWWPRPMFPLGPIMAAPLVIGLTEGRAGLKAWWRRICRFRAPVRLYVAAVGGTSALILLSVGLALALGAKMPTAAQWAAWPVIFASLPIGILDGPGPEELSFRGFGQYELQRSMSAFAASLWIGLGVLVWHFPILVTGGIPWPIAIALPAVSVVYAWLYQVSRSVWPLVALHVTVNLVSGAYFGSMFSKHDDELYIAFFTLGLVAWALALRVRLGPGLGGKGVTTAESMASPVGAG